MLKSRFHFLPSPISAARPAAFRIVTLLITCETAGTAVPENFRSRDGRAGDQNPAAVDHGAGQVANQFAVLLGAPVLINRFRHDLVDVTRSFPHRICGERICGGRSESESSEESRQQLFDVIYRPYHVQVKAALERVLHQFPFVIHLSVRTFDVRQGGKLLRTDVGLLYDPSRDEEVGFCLDWIDELYDAFPHLRVRRNYPQRGTMNRLTQEMRRTFPENRYLGIEIWLNRAWAGRRVRMRDEAVGHLAETIRRTIGEPFCEAA